MSGTRFVDEGKLLGAAERLAVAEDPARGLANFTRWLKRQPEMPDLVGVTVAAQILSVGKSRIYRLVENGTLPEPFSIELTGPVWLREDVERAREAVDAKRRRRRDPDADAEPEAVPA